MLKNKPDSAFIAFTSLGGRRQPSPDSSRAEQGCPLDQTDRAPWQRLEVSNAVAPATELIVYGGNAEFYVESAFDAAQPTPIDCKPDNQRRPGTSSSVRMLELRGESMGKITAQRAKLDAAKKN
jgi:hypothetical protein